MKTWLKTAFKSFKAMLKRAGDIMKTWLKTAFNVLKEIIIGFAVAEAIFFGIPFLLIGLHFCLKGIATLFAIALTILLCMPLLLMRALCCIKELFF